MLGFIALMAVLTAVGAYFWLYTSFHGSGPLEKETVFIIPKGASSRAKDLTKPTIPSLAEA